MHTKTSQAGGQSGWGGGPSRWGSDGVGQAGWGCVCHVADHCWGAWAEVYEVVVCSLAQDLVKKIHTVDLLSCRSREKDLGFLAYGQQNKSFVWKGRTEYSSLTVSFKIMKEKFKTKIKLGGLNEKI